MSCSKERKGMDRRKFIKLLLGVSVGGQAFSYGASSRAKLPIKALGFSPLQEQPAINRSRGLSSGYGLLTFWKFCSGGEGAGL